MTASIESVFNVDRVTKNTIRFEEVLESELASAKIGTIYVPKSTLAELGFKDGDGILVALSIAPAS